MAESKGIENALAAILAKMETMSEEIKADKEEMIADMQRISEECKARNEEMIAIRQKFWDEMDADREERMAKLQEMSADIEVDLTVENIVPCDNFEVPDVLVEHTSGNCGDEVIVYNVTDIACESRERIIESEAIIGSDSVCTCLLYTSRCV